MKNLLFSVIFAITAIASFAVADAWPDPAQAGKKTGGGENDVALLVAVSTYENLENSAQVPGAVENLKAWQHQPRICNPAQ